MPYGIYVSAEGALAQNSRLETIAHNLANIDTPGFKRDFALFQARPAEETAQGNDYHGSGSINDVGGGVALRETRTDFSTGPFKSTGVATDMAIKGEGFFVVNKNNEDHLTRAGNFTFDSNGVLMTQEGDPVLNVQGVPVTIDPELGPWELTPDGSIRQAGIVNPLALVNPGSLGDLVKVGENLFRPLAPTTPVAAADRAVVNNFLETSGVKPTLEMMEMIEASRAFEANVNLIRNHDEMLGTLINRVLRT